MSDARNPTVTSDTLMLRERYQVARGKPPSSSLLAQSQQRLVERTALLPDTTTVDTALPIVHHRDDIIKALQTHQVIVVSGETGSGKTTQLPRYAMAAGFGRCGMIGHTQPRRLAARSVAARIAEETRMPFGQGVGYSVRFDDHSSPNTLVRLMTDGILLNELQRDRLLLAYEVIIIDEAHERSLNIDFLLGVLAVIAPKRPELKIIITSATIDHERFAAHFSDAPVIEVSGRGYPVDVAYRDAVLNADDSRSVARAVCDAVGDVLKRKLPANAKDLLVFLPGEREIRDAERAIARSGLAPEASWELLPLYGRLSDKQQGAVFRPSGKRRIVLATNVAETSLTVPRIGAVIDSGLARVNRYSHRSRIQRLQLEPISQASANQRAGRCGRLGPGYCVRLYSEEDFDARPAFTDPEILRNNLASVLLQLLALGLGEPESFPFLDRPDPAQIDDARRLLFELGATNQKGALTKTGRTLSRLPLDPRLGRMLLAPIDARLSYALVVAVASLSVQDPRQRPLEHAALADAAHAKFRDTQSDFLSMLRLWCLAEEQRKTMKRREFERWCESVFLSPRRMREWHEVVSQLLKQLKVARTTVKVAWLDDDNDRERLHKALLVGLLTHVGNREEQGVYVGAQRKRFGIHPSSTLSARTPPWVMALEIVQTRKRLARTVAPIDAQWLVTLGAHLIEHEYEKPYWQGRRGRVEARRTGLLSGLVVEAAKRVNFAEVDREMAREVFILEGLVKDKVRTRARFIDHNRAQRESIAQLAGKMRRAVEISDQAMADLYAERLPAHVFDAASLKRWLSKNAKAADSLCFDQQTLTSEQPQLEATQTPDAAVIAGNTLAVEYQFAPTRDDDGASVKVPQSLLAALSDADVEHAVPAYLCERVDARLRALPKPQRRRLHPIGEHARRITDWLLLSADRQPLNARLSRVLLREYQMQVLPNAWESVVEADHLKPRLVVIDEKGKTVRAGRDLAQLRRDAPRHTSQEPHKKTKTAQPQSLTDWPEIALPQQTSVYRGDVVLTVYPALAKRGSHITVAEFLEPIAASRSHVEGVLRFVQLRFKQQFKMLRKALIGERRVQLLWAAFDDAGGERLIADYLDGVVLHSAQRPLGEVRSQDDWKKLCDTIAGSLVMTGEQIREQLVSVLSAHANARDQLTRTNEAYQEAIDDVSAQVDALVFPGFISATPTARFADLERFLNAGALRLERIASGSERDYTSMAMIHSLHTRMQTITQTPVGPNQASALEDFGWSLQELRVSLFAQTLGTREKVSFRRLEKRWDEILRLAD